MGPFHEWSFTLLQQGEGDAPQNFQGDGNSTFSAFERSGSIVKTGVLSEPFAAGARTGGGVPGGAPKKSVRQKTCEVEKLARAQDMLYHVYPNHMSGLIGHVFGSYDRRHVLTVTPKVVTEGPAGEQAGEQQGQGEAAAAVLSPATSQEAAPVVIPKEKILARFRWKHPDMSLWHMMISRGLLKLKQGSKVSFRDERGRSGPAQSRVHFDFSKCRVSWEVDHSCLLVYRQYQ